MDAALSSLESRCSGADKFDDPERLDHLEKRVDFAGRSDDLEDQAFRRHVDDVGSEQIADRDDLVPVRIVRLDLDVDQLPADRLPFFQLDNLDDGTIGAALKARRRV